MKNKFVENELKTVFGTHKSVFTELEDANLNNIDQPEEESQRDKNLRSFGFNKEVDAKQQGLCPFCHKKIDPETEFEDELSKKEYKISGLCQQCQNKVFG